MMETKVLAHRIRVEKTELSLAQGVTGVLQTVSLCWWIEHEEIHNLEWDQITFPNQTFPL